MSHRYYNGIGFGESPFSGGGRSAFGASGGAQLTSSIMQTTITLKRIMAHPCFPLGSVLAVFFILPRFGRVAVMVGCAGILSAFVWAQPERFRGRGGSMRLAMCLVIAMWIAAAVVATLELVGGLHD